jgi:hypothetical protein
MWNKPVSTSRAKDKAILVDLDDMALAMYADSMFLTDQEYANLKAQQQYAKDNKLRTRDIVTAVVFLVVTIAAIIIATTCWGFQ